MHSNGSGGSNGRDHAASAEQIPRDLSAPQAYDSIPLPTCEPVLQWRDIWCRRWPLPEMSTIGAWHSEDSVIMISYLSLQPADELLHRQKGTVGLHALWTPGQRAYRWLDPQGRCGLLWASLQAVLSSSPPSVCCIQPLRAMIPED